MSEIYYKIPGSILTEIADALRERKGTTKQYAPEEFAKVILSMVVKPVENVSVEISINDIPTFSSLVTGILPTVHKSAVTTELDNISSNFIIETSATGIIIE